MREASFARHHNLGVQTLLHIFRTVGKQQGHQAVFGSGSKVAGYLSLMVLLFTLFYFLCGKGFRAAFQDQFPGKTES